MARLNWKLVRKQRVPFVPQMEAAECGVACLSMILRYHGAAHPLSALRAVCDTGRDGVSAAKIYRAGLRLGLSAKALRVEPAQLQKVALPAIAHWEFNHFVVIAAADRKGALVVDPAIGERRVSYAELSESFTGVLLTFQKSPAFRPHQLRSESLGRLFDVVRSFKQGGAALIAAVLVLELLGLLLPAGTQVLIDHVLIPNRERWLWPLLIGVGVCSLAAVITGGLRDGVLRRLYFAADVELASTFTERLLRLPLAFFELRSTGDLMQRVEAQRTVRDAVLRGVTALLDGLLLIGYSALMLAYDLRVGGAILGLGVLHAAGVLATRQRVSHATASELAAQGREGQVVVEALAAPELVRAFAAEELLEQRQEERCIARLNAEVEQRSVSERALQLSSAAEGLAHAAVIGLGGQLVLADQITLGVFSGLLTLQGLFQKPLRSLVESVALFGRMRAVFARLDDVLAERGVERGSVVLARPRGELRLRGVTFRHEGQAAALIEDLDLTIAPGEKVALVGRSGQGKSTLLRLLSGLLPPSQGEVLLDEVDLRQLAPEWLAKHVGVVLQEPLLLDDSVRANLALSAPDASAQDLGFAARVACIDERIARLRDGYETQLGAGASRLSGGERQRLALARALVRRPLVLLLDEATSSLDLATEARVHRNLGELGCTRVVIAHRLATVRDADRILVIEAGKIVQQGKYDELARAPGLFAQLVESAEARVA
jgi:ATP-binding cassette subfamily B protein